MSRILAILPVVLLLAACADEPEEQPSDDRRGAEGEVLGGTISDAMLPLDTVQSQSPQLRESPAAEAGGSSTPAAGAGSDGAAAAAEAGEAEPAPEATSDEDE